MTLSHTKRIVCESEDIAIPEGNVLSWFLKAFRSDLSVMCMIVHAAVTIRYSVGHYLEKPQFPAMVDILKFGVVPMLLNAMSLFFNQSYNDRTLRD